MAFWDRKLADIKGQPVPRDAFFRPSGPLVGPLAHIQRPAGQQPAPVGQGQLPPYVEQQLAVHHAGYRERELAEHIQHNGYIKTPPTWVRRQPRDRCPNCNSPDYAAVSAGGYAQPGAPGSILRCFDCNYSSSRGVSALWGLPPSGPVSGAAVQSRDGTVPLKNTGLITG